MASVARVGQGGSSQSQLNGPQTTINTINDRVNTQQIFPCFTKRLSVKKSIRVFAKKENSLFIVSQKYKVTFER